MRLHSSNSIFNMGDTSLRVKRQVSLYRLLLEVLDEFQKNRNGNWDTPASQEEWYKLIHAHIIELENRDGSNLFENFNREYVTPSGDKLGKRGRTWTNPLVKNGLLTPDRSISKVGRKYLDDNIQEADILERLMTKDITNLLYFRQYLKLRIYNNNSDDFVYIFRIAIKFLTIYENVPVNHFLRIIESIHPTYDKSKIEGIISEYSNVVQNKTTFDSYYNTIFSDSLLDKDEMASAKSAFSKKDITDLELKKFFVNRKSGSAQEAYLSFYRGLEKLHLEIQEGRLNNSTIELVANLGNLTSIKKAFGFGAKIFEYTRAMQPSQFIEANKDQPLLNCTPFDIYMQFILSKKYDVIKEYSDMCERSFRATGIIKFANGLVNLNDGDVLKVLLDYLGDSFTLCGNSPYDDYERRSDSIWYEDITIIQILALNEKTVTDEILPIIGRRHGIDFLGSDNSLLLQKHIEDRQEKEFRNFINSKFPTSKVIELLKAIDERNDNFIHQEVTENATVPTIFEYLLTIAWYHLSCNKNFNISKSFGVSLDGDYLPLSHRPGGAGDIEIIASEYSLLIEATLMDVSNQRRAELEPVIRHSTNFKIQNQNHTDKIQTIFVANTLDTNVMNIFRAVQHVQLNGSAQTGTIDGLSIFGLTTLDIANLLEHSKSDEHILSVLQKNVDVGNILVKNNWDEDIKKQIFA